MIYSKINKTLEEINQIIFKSWFIDFEPVKIKLKALTMGEDPAIAAMSFISGIKKDEVHRLAKSDFENLQVVADLFPNKLEEHSEFGLLPENWSWKPLYETAEYVNGLAFRTEDLSANNEGMPIVKITELKLGITPQTRFTTRSVDKKYEIDDGALLYAWSGSPETSLEVFKWFGGKGLLNQHIFLINTDSNAQKVYVYNLLKHLKPELIEIAKNKQTTGLGHITVADMKRIHVPYPDKNGFHLIDRFLSPFYDIESTNTLINKGLQQSQ